MLLKVSRREKMHRSKITLIGTLKDEFLDSDYHIDLASVSKKVSDIAYFRLEDHGDINVWISLRHSVTYYDSECLAVEIEETNAPSDLTRSWEDHMTTAAALLLSELTVDDEGRQAEVRTDDVVFYVMEAESWYFCTNESDWPKDVKRVDFMPLSDDERR